MNTKNAVVCLANLACVHANAGSYLPVLPPINPTSTETCREFSARQYAITVEMEQDLRACWQSYRSADLGIHKVGVSTPNCGGEELLYLRCAPISDQLCKQRNEQAVAVADCYKDVSESQKLEAARAASKGRTSLAEKVASSMEGARTAKTLIQFAKPTRTSLKDSSLIWDWERDPGKMSLVQRTTKTWLYGQLPDMASSFVTSTSRQELRELSLSKTLSTNLALLGEPSKFVRGVNPFATQQFVLSSTLTVRFLADVYQINQQAIQQLDAAFLQAAESRTLPGRPLRPEVAPVRPDDDEGGSIGR